MKSKALTAISLAVGLLGFSSGAFAAAGDSNVSGTAFPGAVNKSIGNAQIGIAYNDVVVGHYSQQPGADQGPQIVTLVGLTHRDLTASFLGKKYPIVALYANARGTREGSHMTGDANGQLIFKDSVIWSDARSYDVNVWAGSEAEVAKSERVFNYDTGIVRSVVIVAGIPVTFGAGLSGSVSLTAAALSDFNSNDGRHGRAHGTTNGVAQAKVIVAAGVGVPGIFGGEVASDNTFTIAYPAVGVATWDYTTAQPIDRRNSYVATAVLNLGGSAEGTFAAQVFGPGGVIVGRTEIGKWSAPDLFKTVIKRAVATDVGRYK